MDITEVSVKLIHDEMERVLAFCSVTFDHSFVVRDVKIIEGANGLFVAMPSRKSSSRCPKCHAKNQVKANFCNHCGCRLPQSPEIDSRHRKLYTDIAHPINPACREMLQEKIIAAYQRELELAQQPDYVTSFNDYGEESSMDFEEQEPVTKPPHFQQRRPHREPAQTGFGSGVFDN